MLLLGLACLIAVAGDEDEIVALCMCCIPLESAFPGSYVVFFAIIVYAVKYGVKLRLNWPIFTVLGMVLWETAHCFGEDFAIVQYAGRMVPLLLLAMLMSNWRKKYDYTFITRAFAISTAAMCCTVIGKYLFLANFNPVVAFASFQRLGVISEEQSQELLVTGAEINVNSLGILCVFGVTGLVQLRFAGYGKKMDFLMIAILLSFGIMTTSRTFVVCLLLMALLLLFSLKSTLRKKMQFLLAAVLLGVAVFLLMYLFVPSLVEYYVSRFFEKDLTTGRLDLMALYGDYIMSNLHVLLWGIGCQDLGHKLVNVYQIATGVPHNAIQELIIAWGIPGLLLIMSLLASMIVRSRKQYGRQGLINYILLIIILFKAQAGQLITSEYTMLALSLSYLSMCSDLQPGAAQREAVDTAPDSADGIGIDFGRAVALLWRKKIIIAAVAVIGAVTAYGITAVAVTPRYDSKAMFYVNNSKIELKSVQDYIHSSDLSVSRSMVDVYGVILKAHDTLTEVIERTGVALTYEELRAMITTKAVNETEIFEVAVRSVDPVQAELLANGIAEVLPERIAEIVDGAAASVVDYAVQSAKPSWPSKAEHALLGGIFSLVLVVTILLLRGMLDTTLRTEEDLAAAYSYPMLAAIPDLTEKKQKQAADYYKR
nr:hypothetical protein [Clostridia bacterium]